jgi:hypothetical protein
MAFAGEAQDDLRWEDLLAQLGLEFYHDRLVDAAIDDPQALACMIHGDAMDILKELEVSPGHRHRLLKACVDSMRTSEVTIREKVDYFWQVQVINLPHLRATHRHPEATPI